MDAGTSDLWNVIASRLQGQLYGLPGWPAYARATLAAAQDYAYRILKTRYGSQWRTGPPRWGAISWGNDYRTASYSAAAAYSLRVLIAEARAAGVIF